MLAKCRQSRMAATGGETIQILIMIGHSWHNGPLPADRPCGAGRTGLGLCGLLVSCLPRRRKLPHDGDYEAEARSSVGGAEQAGMVASMADGAVGGQLTYLKPMPCALAPSGQCAVKN